MPADPVTSSTSPGRADPAGPAGSAARLVAVTGARGGLGASTLLANLAWALSREVQRVALVDLDPAGGLGLLLGEDELPGLRWADLPVRETAFRPGRLVGALPVWHSMPMLTGDARGGPVGRTSSGPPDASGLPAPAGAALAALASRHDVVVVDLPRGLPAPVSAHVLLLTGRDLRSAVAAEVLAPRLWERAASVSLVVRGRGEDISTVDLERITGCPVLGTLPTDRSVAQRLARGEDPVRARSATRRFARTLARHLASWERWQG